MKFTDHCRGIGLGYVFAFAVFKPIESEDGVDLVIPQCMYPESWSLDRAPRIACLLPWQVPHPPGATEQKVNKLETIEFTERHQDSQPAEMEISISIHAIP